MTTLSVEYRYRVVQLTEDGYSTAEVVEPLGVRPSRVRSIKALRREGKSLAPKSKADRRRPRADREGDRLRDRVREKPATTLADLRHDLGLTTSISNPWNALRALGSALGSALGKSRPGRPTGTGPGWSPPGPSGRSRPPASTPAGSSSPTRRSGRPRGPGPTGGGRRPSGCPGWSRSGTGRRPPSRPPPGSTGGSPRG